MRITQLGRSSLGNSSELTNTVWKQLKPKAKL